MPRAQERAARPTGGPSTLVDALAGVVARGPDDPAVRGPGTLWTYGQLWDRAGIIAAGLLRTLGQQPGTRVGVLGPNEPAFLAAYLGILRAGGVPVLLNPLLLPDELATQLEVVGASLCLVGNVQPTVAATIAGRVPVASIADLEARHPAVRELPTVRAADEATILLTSGTTGSPKGAVHSQATMLHAALQMRDALPYERTDVMLAFLPFFAAIPEQILPTLLAGASLEVLPRFDLDAIDEACDRATTLDAVPTLMARLIQGIRPSQLARLRWVVFASEPMPPAVLARWWETVPTVSTYQFYGMTEMLTITVAPPDMLRAAPTTVGRPFPTSDVRVVGDDLAPVPTGDAGEIVCSSPARMVGYLPEGIDPASWRLPDGAMRTGDVGRFDADGRLHLTGRIKDLIISGGLNIAPAELEAIAVQHDSVAAAVVVGIPHPRWGETPVLVALRRPGAAPDARELLQFCRARLASFKRPRAAAVVDELPQTGIGKSSKTALRELIVRGEIELTHEA